MKKLISIIFVCILAFMITACSNETKTTTTTNESSTNNTNTTEIFKAIPKEELKVGVLYIGDPAEGSGYTYAHDVGVQKMKKEIGLSDEQVICKTNVADNDPSAIESAMLECIEEGCKLILATSWGYLDTCSALSKQYPDVLFTQCCGYENNGTNYANYYGRMYQARYLSGIAAGLKTKSNKIGFVAAWGADSTEITCGIDAFAMGVASVNDKAKVYVKVTNSWYDPEGERAAATALINSGCDVIAQHCDTANPQLAAEEANVYSIGWTSDMSKEAPKSVLTSCLWNWDAYYTKVVNDVINGTWNCESYLEGVNTGIVSLADLSDLCADGTKEAVDAALAKIKDGTLEVFSGVIETNDGKTVGEEGKVLDDQTIMNDIHWYYKNVEVK
ncbi:Basic membrane lipoprotein [Lachnospiraceae bacterium TWA4]|nr:Basic membrane lipoprotein [Lachnospiraceae bacterium TWA4]